MGLAVTHVALIVTVSGLEEHDVNLVGEVESLIFAGLSVLVTRVTAPMLGLQVK